MLAQVLQGPNLVKHTDLLGPADLLPIIAAPSNSSSVSIPATAGAISSSHSEGGLRSHLSIELPGIGQGPPGPAREDTLGMDADLQEPLFHFLGKGFRSEVL